MLSVIFAECHKQAHYGECRYAECRFTECRHAEHCYDECRYAECHYAECCYAECCYAECRYAECRYAECCGALSNLMFSFSIMLFKTFGTLRLKNVNNCFYTNIYSYLETPGGQSFDLYLNVAHLFNTSVN